MRFILEKASLFIIKYMVSLLACFLFFIAEAQPPKEGQIISNIDTVKNLNVGDAVPDIFIAKMLNQKERSGYISAYKDALLILDFWTTGCSACIAAFPKMDSLQNEFRDKIKILAVTFEQENHVKTFFRNNKYGKATLLPSVVEDKVLNRWFKHWAIPHEVWIYKGKVIALTSDEYVTSKNIRFILNGNIPNWPIKNDFQKIDEDKLLINAESSKTISYTAITPFKEGVHDKKISSSLDSVTKIRRNYFLNLAILPAYKILWNYLVNIPFSARSPNRLILNVKDRGKYVFDPDSETKEEWNRKNQYCYESITPDDKGRDIKEQYRLIISDLNRLFGLDAHWEKRRVNCLVLIRTSSEDKIRSKGGQPIVSLDKAIKELRNTSVNNLVYALNNYEGNPPVFDETGYKDPVDIKLNGIHLTNIQEVRSVLQSYGLDLKEEQRELDMFVVIEK